MSVSIAAAPGGQVRSQGQWIYKRNWDLAFISLSVLLVPVPYLTWLFMRDVLGWNADFGRQLINLAVFAIIAGPHTYATFTRTFFDGEFRTKHKAFVRSSVAIPLIVLALALVNLTLLLTIFFFWASLHTIHQILYVVDSYDEKAKTESSKPRPSAQPHLADYALLITAIYPIAAYRIAISQDFAIGPNKLNEIIPAVFEKPWLFVLAITLFGLALAAFVVSSIRDYRRGTLHVPKTIFISAAFLALFFIPLLNNLDTAFQGINVWHCTQYLALTWFINRLRADRGELKKEPLIDEISAPGHARFYYGFNLALTLGTVVVIGITFAILYFLAGGKWAQVGYAFETAYYIGVLGFLWIHYYHDHFLFTQPEAVIA